MAYTITLTDGTVFATVADGTVNQSSSVTLIGKNYAGYGDFLDENFVQMLENFSSDSSGGNPTSSKLAAPLRGQLWWDKTNSLLKVWAGSSWKTISAATASASAPSNNVVGDLWFDTSNQQLKVWTGAAFLVVGPAYSASQGTSGAIPETILDSVGATKYVTSLYVNNSRVGIVYDGASFVPQASLLATFPRIYPGITLTTANSPIFAGTANNASYLNNLTSSQFMRSDTNTSTTGALSATGNITTAGYFLGNFAGNITGNLNVPGSNTQVLFNTNGNADAASTLVFNKSTNVLTVTGTSSTTGNVIGGNIRTAGLVSATGNINATGNVSGGNVISAANVNAVGVSASGNITGAAFIGDGGYLSNISAAVSVSQIQSGTSRVQIGATDGNANVTIAGTSNVAVFTTGGAIFTNVTTPNIEKSGSNAVGNLGTSSNWFNQTWVSQVNATTVSAAGNVRTAGFVSATGNIDGSNLRTAGQASATGNVTGGNINTSGQISATGNITTAGYFVGNFAGNVSGNIVVPGSNTQVLFNTNGNADAVSTFVFNKASNVLTVTGTSSTTGNVIGGNVTTAGQVSAGGNVTGGNVLTAGAVSATGNVSGNFFIGNGSLLTGISGGGGGGGSSISNGTSQVNIPTSGGNANVTIGGTSNVMVVATTGVFVTGLASVTGNITGGNLSVGTGTISGGNIVNNNANGVGNIGSSTTYFNRVFATATTALYADVAERFAADEYLEPGTVVELGGIKEITRSTQELSENIFGVISTRPAMLMNGGAGEDLTHPPVAMTGRVPVRVIGAVRKGDRLVSAGAGIARAARPGEATAFNVIGRALEDKSNMDSGQVEAIVTIK